MLFFYLLSSLLAVATAAPATITSSAPASATTPCQAKTFDKPWTLSDITIYQASGQDLDNQHGAISFHFCDYNDGLQMETDCEGTIINDRCEGDDGGYVFCMNQTVAFKLAPELLMMERAFIDDCLGPYPYNGAIAFGQNNTNMQTTPETGGTLWSQEFMLVEITQMS